MIYPKDYQKKERREKNDFFISRLNNVTIPIFCDEFEKILWKIRTNDFIHVNIEYRLVEFEQVS